MSSNFTVNKICICCGNIFEARTTVTKYCSKRCNKRYLKKQERGEKLTSVDKLVEKLANKTGDDLSAREFLSVKLGAKLLGVSERIVFRMIRSGMIRSANLAQRKTVIYRSDIDKLFKLAAPAERAEKELRIQDCYNMAEAQSRFGISEKALYDLIKKHNLPKIKSGWYSYVSKRALEKIFDESK